MIHENLPMASGVGENPSPVELFEKHMSLARTVAGRVASSIPPFLDIEDMHQDALMGLWEACRTYDSASKASFETYARPRVRGAIFDQFRKLDVVPRSVRDKQKKITDRIRTLTASRGYEVSVREAIEDLEMSPEDAVDCHFAVQITNPQSLSSMNLQKEGSEGEEFDVPDETHEISYGENLDIERGRELLMLALKKLPPVQRSIVVAVFWENIRLKTLGAALGFTESRACQVLDEALKNLRTLLKKIS